MPGTGDVQTEQEFSDVQSLATFATTEVEAKIPSLKKADIKGQTTSDSLTKEETELAVKVTNAEEFCHVKVIPSDSVKGAASVHLVFVVDVSGSMQSQVESVSADGSKENHGFSILDLVKHSLLTIVNSLGKTHFVTLISFTSDAKVELEAQKMDKKGVKRAEDAINALYPQNSTNLWAGLRTGMDSVKKFSDISPTTRSEIMLFTDGMPNNNPPRGHVPEMQRYMENNEIPAHCVRTYGFGYNLNCRLLEEIAVVGNGNYCFIPDAGFVGTIFIHAVADILTSCHVKDLKLKIEFGCENVTDEHNKFLGSFPMGFEEGLNPVTGNKTLQIALGNLELGQTRDIIISKPKSITSVSVGFYDCVAADSKSIWVDAKDFVMISPSANPSAFALARNSAKPHIFRLEMCEALHKFITKSSAKFGIESSSYGCREQFSSEEFASLQPQLKSFIERFKQAPLCDYNFEVYLGESENDKFFNAVLEDVEGQVVEAFSKLEFFKRWGEFYIRSLIMAHQQQKRNNFKDPGVQTYGGQLFESEVDRVNDIFDKLAPPKPSNTHAARSQPVQNMSVYNNCYGPCFGPESLVALATGETRACKDIKKGDLVATADGGSAAIRCVIKTVGQNIAMVDFASTGLLITPWHPVYVGNEWIFPAQLFAMGYQNAAVASTGVTYNFLLEKCIQSHTIIVDTVKTCTLGHGLFDNEVISHAYFGDYSKIERDLKVMPGFEKGLVLMHAETCCLKNADGLVDKMVSMEVGKTLLESCRSTTNNIRNFCTSTVQTC